MIIESLVYIWTVYAFGYRNKKKYNDKTITTEKKSWTAANPRL